MAISLLAAGCTHKDLSEKVNKRPLDGVSLNQLQNRGIDGYYVFETDNPYNGEVIDYYDNQQIKYLAKIEFGFKEGLWTSWHQNGGKSTERNWIKGKPHGSAIEWYGNGNKSVEQNFINGNHDGLIIRWHQNGKMMSKVEYLNGKMVEGSDSYWNSNHYFYFSCDAKPWAWFDMV